MTRLAALLGAATWTGALLAEATRGARQRRAQRRRIRRARRDWEARAHRRDV